MSSLTLTALASRHGVLSPGLRAPRLLALQLLRR